MPDAKSKATPVSVEEMPPPLDARCPPRRVRHKKSGMITSWSMLFRKRITEFEPFYRPGTDELLEHKLRFRRFEAMQAMRSGDPFAGVQPGYSSLAAAGVAGMIDADFSHSQ